MICAEGGILPPYTSMGDRLMEEPTGRDKDPLATTAPIPAIVVKIKIQYKNIERLREDWTENISFGGMFIKSGNPLPIQTPVEVSLTLPDHEKTVDTGGRSSQDDRYEGGRRTGIEIGIRPRVPGFCQDEKGARGLYREAVRHGRPSPPGPLINLGPPTDEPILDVSDLAAPGGSTVTTSAESPERIEIKAIQIKNMSVKDKMILAPKADKAERAILLRELNASVARLIIRNPRITESEIAQIAKDFAAPSDVLEMIAKNRKWIQNSEIRLAIVKNPRTPTPLAVAQLNYLQVKDLAMLAKSQSVRETVKNEAFKLLLKKRDRVT